jgi:predicted transposase YbfD/YdcC
MTQGNRFKKKSGNKGSRRNNRRKQEGTRETAMSEEPLASIVNCFGDLEDPRVQGRCNYPLIEIIVIAICAVIAGADAWTEIETFGKSKEGWLKQFLPLKNGIPSHDTFGDVFQAIEADEFQRSFMSWVDQVFRVTEGQVVAIDGKTVRRSHDRADGKAAIHLVNAWASANGITLGQRTVAEKANEITAIPELLRLLALNGCIVTIDALGCQKKIAQVIREEKADYVLQVKDNQKQLRQDLADWFGHADQTQFKEMQHDYAQTVNKGHGRIEIRRCWTIADPQAFEYIRQHQGWADLQTIIRVQRERQLADKTQVETAYYISSLPPNAKQILDATRAHWTVENSLHWVLDVTFNEDASRVRKDNSPDNFAVIRQVALNILKQDKSKGSLRQKRYRATLDDSFLLSLLTQI